MNRFQTYLVEEFAEDYQEGHLSRREALKLIAGVTGSLLVANSILAGCTPADQSAAPSTLALATTSTPEPPVTPEPATPANTSLEQPETAAPKTAGPGDFEIEAADIEFPGEGA